jgi:hypothetical protein
VLSPEAKGDYVPPTLLACAPGRSCIIRPPIRWPRLCSGWAC